MPDLAGARGSAPGTRASPTPDEIKTPVRAGDIGVLEPGHDAWVGGDEPVVFIDLSELIMQAGGTPIARTGARRPSPAAYGFGSATMRWPNMVAT